MDKRPGHGRVTERLTVTKQTAEVALVADHIYRVERGRCPELPFTSKTARWFSR